MKQLSLDQTKTFLSNLATAMLPGSKFALWVESTPRKNRFSAIVLPPNYNYNTKNPFTVSKPKFLLIAPSFDPWLRINGLDSFIKNANPRLMLCPDQAVDLEWLVDTFKCDPNKLYQMVLHEIRSRASAALNNQVRDGQKKFFIKAVENSMFDVIPAIKTAEFSSMEELYIWADLHANCL